MVPPIVLVHGIGNLRSNPTEIRREWLRSLNDGIRTAQESGYLGWNIEALKEADLQLAFYRPAFQSRVKGSAEDTVDPNQLDAEEVEVLRRLLAAAEREDVGFGYPSKAAVPLSVQQMVLRLAATEAFADCPPRQIPTAIRQVSLYQQESEVRSKVQAIFVESLRGAKVVLAHSLGSVVAYEGLCAVSDVDAYTFITLGSPLGWRPQVFERLIPAPIEGRGHWPNSVYSWTNVANRGDPVAICKRLAPLFPASEDCPPIADHVVKQKRMHAVASYLTQRATIRAIVNAL